MFSVRIIFWCCGGKATTDNDEVAESAYYFAAYEHQGFNFKIHYQFKFCEELHDTV